MVTSSLPAAPAHLTADGLAEWERVAPPLHKIGLLTVVDMAALAAYCQAYGRWVLAERALAMVAVDNATGGLLVKSAKGNPMHNPLVTTARVAMNDMLRIAIEFGMTPSARSRIPAGNVPAQNERGSEFFN